MTTNVTKFDYYAANSLIPLMLEFDHCRDHIDDVIMEIAACLRDPSWKLLEKPLKDLRNRAFEYRRRVVGEKEHVPLNRVGYCVIAPEKLRDLVSQLGKLIRGLCPVHLTVSALLPLKDVVEKMLTDNDLQPLKREINLLKNRLFKIIEKLHNKEAVDVEIEKCGLLNLIRYLGFPIVHHPAYNTSDNEIKQTAAALQGDSPLLKLRELIIKSPKSVNSRSIINDRVNVVFHDFCKSYNDHPYQVLLSTLELMIRAGVEINPRIFYNISSQKLFHQSSLLLNGTRVNSKICTDTDVRGQFIKTLVAAGVEPKFDSNLPFDLIDAHVRDDVSRYRDIGDSWLPHLTQAGMDVNSLRIVMNGKDVEVQTPISYGCQISATQESDSKSEHHLEVISMLGWLVYEGAIVRPQDLEGASKEACKRIISCLHIKNECRKHILEIVARRLEFIEGAHIVMSYHAISETCYEYERHVFTLSRQLSDLPFHTQNPAFTTRMELDMPYIEACGMSLTLARRSRKAAAAVDATPAKKFTHNATISISSSSSSSSS